MNTLPYFTIQDDMIELPPGTYRWCQCGCSTSQPFCDGSHNQPCNNALEVTISKPQTIALCRNKEQTELELVD